MNDRRRWALAALAAGVVVAIVRRWTSRGRDEYAIWPDEPAQLAIARFIGGGTRWTMDDHSVWRPLFGTLLAPAHWFTSDPVTILHTALVLNALLGGVAAALLVVLARRLTPVTPGVAVGAAVVVSLMPGALFTTDFVFSESLIAPLFLSTLLALLWLQETPTLSRGLVVAALAAAAFATHSRMLPLALVGLAVVAVAAWRRRLERRDAAVVASAIVGAAVLVEAYTRWIVARLWDEPSTRNSPSAVLEQLRSGLPVLVSLIGQTWYQLVASVGVVAYGAIVLVRRGRSRDTETSTIDARIVVATVGACVLLSVVFMADRSRSDQLVYGRYNDAVMAPVVLLGVVALIGAMRMWRPMASAVGAAVAILSGGAVLWRLREDELSVSNGLEPMILGLQPFATSATAIEVVRISIWAAGLTLTVAFVSQLRAPPRRVVAFGVLLALVGVGWWRTAAIVDRSWDDAGDVSAVQLLRSGVLAGNDTVDFHLPPGNTATNRLMLYQYYLPGTEFVVVNGVEDASSALVFARLDAEGFAEPPARLIWTDPKGRYGLFRR